MNSIDGLGQFVSRYVLYCSGVALRMSLGSTGPSVGRFGIFTLVAGRRSVHRVSVGCSGAIWRKRVTSMPLEACGGDLCRALSETTSVHTLLSELVTVCSQTPTPGRVSSGQKILIYNPFESVVGKRI